MPEAVVCANDCMAYSLCDVLSSAGVLIPDQITVTGYDCIGERMYHYPILTTYRSGRHNVGVRAVNILLSSNCKLDESDRFISGNTCACGTNSLRFCEEMRIERIVHPDTYGSSVAQFCAAGFFRRPNFMSNHFRIYKGTWRLFLHASRCEKSFTLSGQGMEWSEIRGRRFYMQLNR